MIYDKDGNAVRNEDGTPVGSVDVNELPEDMRPKADEADEVDVEDGSEDLSKLHKAELVERAEARGFDTSGLTKAELLEVLEEGDADGDDQLS